MTKQGFIYKINIIKASNKIKVGFNKSAREKIFI